MLSRDCFSKRFGMLGLVTIKVLQRLQQLFSREYNNSVRRLIITSCMWFYCTSSDFGSGSVQKTSQRLGVALHPAPTKGQRTTLPPVEPGRKVRGNWGELIRHLPVGGGDQGKRGSATDGGISDSSEK